MRSDPQGKAAYDWEDSFTLWPGAYLSQKRARELVAAACRKYRIPTPTIRFLKTDRGPSSYTAYDHVIKLRPRHMNAAIVLHETAHAITDYILGANLEPHGAEWLGVYMVLLEDYRIIPRSAMELLAKERGLKYRGRHLVDPKKIRSKYRKRWRQAKTTNWFVARFT